MLNEDLFRQVLLEPAETEGMDHLQIVTGFATANMADRHMEFLSKRGRRVSIDLTIGMARSVGIARAQYSAFLDMAQRQPYGMDFKCRYVIRGNPVHAKTYCWFRDGQPVVAFTGSANYTMIAFSRQQIETMASVDPSVVADFQRKIMRNAVDCMDKEVEDNILLTEPTVQPRGFETVTLSLLTKSGETPPRSGINWGQREKRNPNQAYINIPAPIRQQGFFPKLRQQFTVLTDDGFSFIMVRAQEGGKGLHTTENNALLGEYLRRRMGLPLGEYVTREHLIQYGRTDVSITKIDDETYHLDFRPNLGPGEDQETWQE